MHWDRGTGGGQASKEQAGLEKGEGRKKPMSKRVEQGASERRQKQGERSQEQGRGGRS